MKIDLTTIILAILIATTVVWAIACFYTRISSKKKDSKQQPKDKPVADNPPVMECERMRENRSPLIKEEPGSPPMPRKISEVSTVSEAMAVPDVKDSPNETTIHQHPDSLLDDQIDIKLITTEKRHPEVSENIRVPRSATALQTGTTKLCEENSSAELKFSLSKYIDALADGNKCDEHAHIQFLEILEDELDAAAKRPKLKSNSPSTEGSESFVEILEVENEALKNKDEASSLAAAPDAQHDPDKLTIASDWYGVEKPPPLEAGFIKIEPGLGIPCTASASKDEPGGAAAALADCRKSHEHKSPSKLVPSTKFPSFESSESIILLSNPSASSMNAKFLASESKSPGADCDLKKNIDQSAEVSGSDQAETDMVKAESPGPQAPALEEAPITPRDESDGDDYQFI